MITFRTLELACQYYDLVSELRLPLHLCDQLLRSASSVALNLSEGNAKTSVKDRRRYFEIALGSLRESNTILRSGRVSYQRILSVADHLGGSLYKLSRK